MLYKITHVIYDMIGKGENPMLLSSTAKSLTLHSHGLLPQEVVP